MHTYGHCDSCRTLTYLDRWQPTHDAPLQNLCPRCRVKAVRQRQQQATKPATQKAN